MSVQLPPWFILRSAGFPATTLQMLGSNRSAEVLNHILNLEEAQDTLERDLIQNLAQVEDRTSRNRLKRSLKSRRPMYSSVEEPIPLSEQHRTMWNRLLEQLEQLNQELHMSATTEFEQNCQTLYELLNQPTSQEAIWLSSQGAFAGLQRLKATAPRTAQERELARRALSYLQRFCIKNEWTAFFGPFTLGRVELQDGDSLLSWQAGNTRIAQRYVFVARYAVEALEARIAADEQIAQQLPLALHPLIEKRGASLYLAGQKLSLQSNLVKLLVALEHRPRRELEAAAGSALIAKLIANRLLVPIFGTPTCSLADLEKLLSLVSALQGEEARVWELRLQDLDQAARQTAESPWPERQKCHQTIQQHLQDWGVTAYIQDRAGGELYTDRYVLNEEARGNLENLTLNGQLLLKIMPPLETMLRAHAAYAEGVRRDAREWLLSLWDRAGLGDEVPLGALLQILETAPEAFRPFGWSQTAEKFWDTLSALCPEDRSRVELTGAQIEALLGDLAPEEPFLCSPDIMLAAPGREALCAGQVIPVLSEVHHAIQLWHAILRLTPVAIHQDIQETVERWSAQISRGRTLATLLDPRMTGKTFTLEYPGLTIERLTRSAKPRNQVLSLWEVRVAREGTMLKLMHDEDELLLAPANPHDPVVRAFGSLVLWGPRSLNFRSHLPRVSVDGAIWFRESWRVPTAPWQPYWASNTAGALLKAGMRLQRTLGLPRYIFVRSPSEPKPYFCDLHSIPSCELLRSLGLRAQELVMTEMFPDFDHLWLDLPTGRYSAELRLALLVGGDGQ